jgi:hypothetical protein
MLTEWEAPPGGHTAHHDVTVVDYTIMVEHNGKKIRVARRSSVGQRGASHDPHGGGENGLEHAPIINYCGVDARAWKSVMAL